METWKPISPQEVGEMMEDQTGYQPDLFEAATEAEVVPTLEIDRLMTP